jgi:inner membrane protein
MLGRIQSRRVIALPRTEALVGPLAVKSGIIAGLTLLMIWPLTRLEGLVNERQAIQAAAAQTIADGFGGEEVVGGPLINVPTEERTVVRDRDTQTTHEVWKTGGPLHLLADELHVASKATVEQRHKGIYTFPVYVATLTLTGQFNPDTVAALRAQGIDSRTLPGQVTLALPLSGLKSLRSVTRFEVGGAERHAEAGDLAGIPAITIPLDLSQLDLSKPLFFQIDLEVAGSQSLHFLPLAANTVVSAEADWPDPDFDGAFLPATRGRTARGFSARWQVLEVNRPIPRMWRGNAVDRSALLATAFGFRLFQPASLYAENYRAVRYGLLFIAVTFVCLFAVEHVGRRLRLHPMQYLLVGLALATFYLLLLAFSEHVGFAIAYAIAAAALVALLAVYLAGVLRSRKAGIGAGAAFTGAYIALYLILLSEDYALLLGALLIFGILGATMLVTRRLDWSAAGRGDPAVSVPSDADAASENGVARS